MPKISYLGLIVLVITRLITITGHNGPWPGDQLPANLRYLNLSDRIGIDPPAITDASTDFGKLVAASPPSGVLYPSAIDDIADLVKASYSSPRPFPIAARGHGHSTHGQAFAPHGVVINMRSLGVHSNNRVSVSYCTTGTGSYVPCVDAGGEQLWIEVLTATLEHGLAPRSWTDYLHLTVGGTLSSGGISGQAFRHGPQISNVYEMDVVTGKGEVMTCSKEENTELFHAVLGGLGQFGIITRARIALEVAPQRVKWVRLLYNDFSLFTEDQMHLIKTSDKMVKNMPGFDYVEGSLVSDTNILNSWRSSGFYFEHAKIRSLAANHSFLYSLEAAKYYDHSSSHTVEQEVRELIKGLKFVPGYVFVNEVGYAEFLDRVHKGEQKLRSQGVWDVPHPWLNLLVASPRIGDFHDTVFKGILVHNLSLGPILLYPINRHKWDDEMSMVVPEEEVFYSVGLLRSAPDGGWEKMEQQNRDIIRFCRSAEIGFKQYLPNYKTKWEWEDHYGPKWSRFLKRKMMFDPKGILSPGQMIFTTTSVQNNGFLSLEHLMHM